MKKKTVIYHILSISTVLSGLLILTQFGSKATFAVQSYHFYREMDKDAPRPSPHISVADIFEITKESLHEVETYQKAHFMITLTLIAFSMALIFYSVFFKRNRRYVVFCVVTLLSFFVLFFVGERLLRNASDSLRKSLSSIQVIIEKEEGKPDFNREQTEEAWSALTRTNGSKANSYCFIFSDILIALLAVIHAIGAERYRRIGMQIGNKI